MPRKYVDDYLAPPRDRGAGWIFIVLIGALVGAVAVGSGWLSLKAGEQSNEHAAAVKAAPSATVRPAGVETEVATATPVPEPAAVPAGDEWDIPGGYFFTQTNGAPPGASARGFAVTNEGAIPFWDEFRRLGGVPVVGYPLSGRFRWKGLETQVFQRAVFQWNVATRVVQEVNIMDELHDAGKDPWLALTHATPEPLPPDFDRNKSTAEAVARRMSLLAPDPNVERFYMSAPDPMALYGLPASPIVDMGDHWAIRLQRNVLQRWKEDKPWARAGQVTAGNSGQLMIEADLLPKEALQPQIAPQLPAA